MTRPYYSEGGITIYHGDCLEILPEVSAVDHVITDPPYSEHVHANAWSGHGSADKITAKPRDLCFAPLTDELVRRCAKAFGLQAKRWVLVFSDSESSHLWRDALTGAGLEYVRAGVWIKHGAAPQFSGDRPANGFDSVTICHPRGRKRWNGGGRHAVWTHKIVNGGRTGRRLHTTQKPQPLLEELVELFTDEGDVILDPFVGSGTTLAAAKERGRKAVGIEIDERYCEIAAKRLAQGVLFGAEVSA